MTHPIVQASEVSKTYLDGRIKALNRFNLSLEAGEILGLLGPNGAGKTTAISIMCSLLPPDSGTVTVCGRRLHGADVKAKACIGLVPQHNALYPSLTGLENLLYFGRLYGLRGRALKDRVRALLELMGLADHAKKQICHYSGGMKRRANLAVGILHTPRLLFLDEPTVGIDAQSRNMILETLADLSREGMAIIYTSHYMEEIQRICDRVIIIDHGNVIAQGRPRDLIEQHTGCDNLEDLFLQLTGTHLRD